MGALDTILLAGGREGTRPHLRELFRDEYNILEADSVEQALHLMEEGGERISAAVVDYPRPGEKSQSFLYQARERGLLETVPAIAVVDSASEEEFALAIGAGEVIVKPFTDGIARCRIRRAVETSRLSRQLEEERRSSSDASLRANEMLVDALSAIIEHRSAEDGSHIQRIRRFTEILMAEVARSCPEYGLSQEDLRNINSAAALHDMGKIAIPDHILNKPSSLTEDEMEIMRGHTVAGSRMIETLNGIADQAYLSYAYDICLYHHERWDGSGYPTGISGEEIPICAQVVGLADAFDAITIDRVYKRSVPVETAVNMLLNGECGCFSPKLLACFQRVVQPFIELTEACASGRWQRTELERSLPSVPKLSREPGVLDAFIAKYQALLRHLKATVVELDIDRDIFQVVYNPLPNFRPLSNVFPLETALDAAAMQQVHPDDIPLSLREYRFLFMEFFDRGLRSHSFTQRLRLPSIGEYRTHKVTFLRLDTGSREQRKALIIWQPLSQLPLGSGIVGQADSWEGKAALLMNGSTVCRKNDRWYTIVKGGGNLLDLLDYTEEEVKTLFKNRFIELIVPEDRDAFRKNVRSCASGGSDIESEYRAIRKDGSIVWIREKGCMVADDEGREYFFGALLDNSKCHELQDVREKTLERMKIIIDQSDSIIFEWDPEKKTVYMSREFIDVLGREPVPAILSKGMLSASRIHPDDFSVVKELSARVLGGMERQEAEIRIANSENRYVWFRLRMSPQLDELGRTTRVIGTLSSLESVRRTANGGREQLQNDALTGLMNMGSAEAAVSSWLASSQRSSSAMMLIDLDSFKSVNERYGQLFGDSVLLRSARTIRRLFRGEDIIGRVGGDEFIVFIKNVRDRELVHKRGAMLIEEMSALFRSEGQNLGISCSVGVAFSPNDGVSFAKLCEGAEGALKAAKAAGGHCLRVCGNAEDKGR